MANDNYMKKILESCEIYYEDSLISNESIMRQYISFFSNVSNQTESKVSFALHTGSICFDAVSVVAVALGCLSLNMQTADDIIESLSFGDLVMFKGEKYRWRGLTDSSVVKGAKAMLLEQDGKGKNGLETLETLFERNKHLIKPYYGSSNTTDGRGIRRRKTNREDFLSFVFDTPAAEISVEADTAAVIVAERTTMGDVFKRVKIKYGDKFVQLLDITPASYYTESGETYQYGHNPTKTEPVLRVTSKMSVAREMVLDKSGNRVIGLMVTDINSLTDNATELTDMLRRRSLCFAYIVTPFASSLGEQIMEEYSEAPLFACTKGFLESNDVSVRSENALTIELNNQIRNVIDRKLLPIYLENGWDWTEYKELKEKLYLIKQSNWSGEAKDEFLLSAFALINLFNNAIFTLDQLETAINENAVNKAVVSPWERIKDLWNKANDAMSVQDACAFVADVLERKYYERKNSAPKADALQDYINAHSERSITVVVPKAYYVELMNRVYAENITNVRFITANRYDGNDGADCVVCVGDIVGKRFNPMQCLTVKETVILLYDSERKIFDYKNKRFSLLERKLNAKVKGIEIPVEEIEPIADEREIERAISQFSDLDQYISTISAFDIRKLISSGNHDGNAPMSEVKVVGSFITGEQILFSKFYSAVVFDQEEGTITEKSPEKLNPGDLLVFTKRDNYTQNIVDYIFNQLMGENRFTADVNEAAEKAYYWKEALREYQRRNNMSYRAIARKMKALGSSLQEVSIRQWLVEDSHIVGPRDEETMERIAKLTQDPYLLADPSGYYGACRLIRRQRREILGLVQTAINEKLLGRYPEPGSIFEVVYENVDKLSEILELENISELEDAVEISSTLVNRPISESEVLL